MAAPDNNNTMAIEENFLEAAPNEEDEQVPSTTRHRRQKMIGDQAAPLTNTKTTTKKLPPHLLETAAASLKVGDEAKNENDRYDMSIIFSHDDDNKPRRDNKITQNMNIDPNSNNENYDNNKCQTDDYKSNKTRIRSHILKQNNCVTTRVTSSSQLVTWEVGVDRGESISSAKSNLISINKNPDDDRIYFDFIKTSKPYQNHNNPRLQAAKRVVKSASWFRSTAECANPTPTTLPSCLCLLLSILYVTLSLLLVFECNQKDPLTIAIGRRGSFFLQAESAFPPSSSFLNDINDYHYANLTTITHGQLQPDSRSPLEAKFQLNPNVEEDELIRSIHDNKKPLRRLSRRAPPSSGDGSGPASLLVCPEGWQQHATQCYRFFHQRRSWARARDACEGQGAQLALVLDYQQNNFTSQLAWQQLARSPLDSAPGTSSSLSNRNQLKLSQNNANNNANNLNNNINIIKQPVYASDEKSYWIGFRAIDRLETNTLESAAGTFVSKYLGFWDFNEPQVTQGECVRATVRHESLALAASSSYKLTGLGAHFTAQQVWQLSQCEELLPFVCQRQVCSSNSFHCANGRCVNAAWKCDGHNDCGDHSDELDCPQRCHYHMQSSGDKLQSPNYPLRYEPNSDCRWTLEGPLESAMMVHFYEFDTERNFDHVQVLAGAKTEERAFSLAQLSGQLNLTSKPLVTGSNMMIVKFKSDGQSEKRGFRASWKTEPIECGGELFAHQSAQLITSPLYPDQYPGQMECVYRLFAPPGKLISLELVEFELADQRDFMLIRDGSSASDPLLASLTGSLTTTTTSNHQQDNRFISSSSNKLYIYFSTEHTPFPAQRSASASQPPLSFAIRFRTGCDVNLIAHNGTLTSPAHPLGQYPANVNCLYKLARPDHHSSSVGLSLRLDELDLAAEDQLLAYDGHEASASSRLQLNKVSNSKSGTRWIHAPSGKLTLRFVSSPALGATGLTSAQQQQQIKIPHRGFRGSFSSDCSPLKLGKHVQIAQGAAAANSSARFGQILSYSCPRGYEFSTGQSRLQNECLLGGRWSLSRVPNCQPRYCGPVPQIDNGFAVNATGVTYNQTALYKCYAGFNLASGKPSETITCQENGSWGKLPECFSTSCPPFKEPANSRQLLLAGNAQTRHYGTVIRFECEPGYQRAGVTSILCTSAGTWSSAPPECVRAQCKHLPELEHAYLVDAETRAPIPTNSRKFLYQDEARVQCHRGYKLDTSSFSTTSNANNNSNQLINGNLIRCGANQTFDHVPRCIDIDECSLATSCDSASTQCKNLPGGYQCDCKPGYSPNLDCKQSLDLGLANHQLPDSAIWVSSTAPNFNKNNIRLFRPGWCGNSPVAQENLVRIDLQSISIIRGLRIQPVILANADSQNQAPVQAFPSLLRLRYANNLTDSFRDYQDPSKRSVQFRLNNLNTAGIFHVQLPIPIEARYLELVQAEFQGGPCMRLEIQGCSRQSCLDINECSDGNNAGCSHRCINSPGSYSCACERGFELYTQNGTNSFFIPPNETGLRDGDTYRLNKTCVQKQCPSLVEPQNGQLLNTQRLFHYGDSVKFKCNFGYVMSSSSFPANSGFNSNSALTCGPNGQWNGSVPECHQAKCKPLSNDRAQGLVARFEPLASTKLSQLNSQRSTNQDDLNQTDVSAADQDGQLAFMANMSVSCREQGRQLRPTASAHFRQCVFSIRNDTGRGDYWFSGTTPSCPKVDCGLPPPTQGALPYQYSDTKFGSSFFFGCEDTYNLAGTSSRSGNVVSCRADGTWDFGDLRCEGPVCQDPGRAPDGEQLATSYEPGSQVNFRCKRTGYVPYTTDPLVCARGAECRVIKPLGLAQGAIPDKSINATTYRDNYEPAKVRLGSSTGWCAKITETLPFITIDLGRPHRIKALLIKGVVTVDVVGRPLEVRVFYKKPGAQDSIVIYPNFNLTTHVDLLQQQLGLANYGELSTLQLPNDIIAQTIGVNIVKSIKNPCMRLEILGCEVNGNGVDVASGDVNPRILASGISPAISSIQSPSQLHNQLGYEQAAPVCVDQEPPQFNNCPEQPISVQRGAYGELLPLNFTIPQATDNSGLVARLEVRPKGFRPGQYTFHDQTAHYVASDNDGNVAICSINITVPDVTPPRLSCPASHVHYLKLTPSSMNGPILGGGNSQQQNQQANALVNSHTFDFNALMRDKIRASDESGPTSIELYPPTGTIQVNHFENVTVIARDRFNNTAQCYFQVHLRTPTCSEQSLVAPANGQLECLPHNGDQPTPLTGSPGQLYQCVATCNENYRFLDGRRAHTYTCDNSQLIAPQVQDCVPSLADDSAYEVLATVNYKLHWGPNGGHRPPQMSSEVLTNCLANYTDLARQYANDLQEILTSRCTTLNGDTNVELRNIRASPKPIVRAQQEELMSIQFELRVDSKIKKGPIFAICGQSIRQTFNLGLPASVLIKPLLNINTSSLIPADEDQQQTGIPTSCPSLMASSSSAVAGYLCPAGFILTNQTAPAPSSGGDSAAQAADLWGDGSSSNDMLVPICLQCPAGTHSSPNDLSSAAAKAQLPQQNQCKLCPRGFYQDQQAQAECKQCPESTSTLLEGSKSLADCQPVCAHGYYSANGLAPCNQCPQNTFSSAPISSSLGAPIGYTDCVKCPSHRPLTYGAGSGTTSECRGRCQPGSYSDTGLEPCSPCPVNFYQSSEGATRCDECPMSNRTLKVGASSADQCAQSSCMPTLNPVTSGPCLPDSEEAQSGRCFAGCQQNGVCTIQLHEPQCHCPAGFKGKFCEIEINECSQEPCYNGGTCIDLKQGYKCKCAPGFSGLQCQIEQSDCKSDTCPERSMCQDLPGPKNFTCLCRTGYTGPNCNITLNPCDTRTSQSSPDTELGGGQAASSSPCLNGAQCVPLQQGRYKCLCEPGWIGPNCDQNVDDCAEEPCLMGAKCTDLINDFHCDCPPGFAGKRCHEKLDQCAEQPCGGNGICVDRLFNFECICKPGWRGERCNQTLEPCASNPCLNNGECINLVPLRSHHSLDASIATTRAPPNDATQSNLTSQLFNNQHLIADLAYEEQRNFMCQCDPRYTGARCQHDVNSCEINKCEHGGTCVDTQDGFECKCKPGFVGLNCEAQVKECAAEPCNSRGTLECQDQVNGHKCVCLPGYTGEKCEQEIDECQLEPCANEAKCEDRVNDYFCACLPGWTGKNCDIEQGKCALEQPCLNQAKCVDLFEDYFCICPSGTDGKRCQTSPRRCVGEPCQNGGQCHDFGSGLNCTCPARYTGSGCQHTHDPCAPNAATCKNGATCVELPLATSTPNGSPPDYQCVCPAGWQGKHCDQDVPDCGLNSCAPNAQCIDLNQRFYCKCPPGWTGDDCRKPLSADFDLAFMGITKSASAAQSLPFEIPPTLDSGPNGGARAGLTVGLWVQFAGQSQLLSQSEPQPFNLEPTRPGGKSNKRQQLTQLSNNPLNKQQQLNAQLLALDPDQQTSAQQGLFLTLYSSASAQKLAQRRELLKFDHSGVSVTLFPNQTSPVFLPYLQTVPINDGQWHHLNLVWDAQSGNLTLTTDSAVAASRQHYGQNESLAAHAPFGYLSLGAELDTSQQPRPIEGSGFQGKLSRVFVWSRPLDVNTEIPRHFRSCKQMGLLGSDQSQLLAHWANYDLLQGNVERLQVSECGQHLCPIGLTGDECAILQQDKQAPRVLSCPPDMWVISANATTPIEWDEPHFIDDLAKPVAVAEQNNLKPGVSLAHGLYDLSYIAVDESGNTARCDFQIHVLKDFCPIPQAPINGHASCKAWGPSGRFRMCSIECQQGFEFSQPVSQYYVCGAEGFWRPTSDPQRELVFPACTPKHSAQRIYRLAVNFASPAICSESGKRILNSKIYENLLRIDQNWKLCSPASSQEERGRCEHLRVQVKCSKQPSLAGQHNALSGPQSSGLPSGAISYRIRRWIAEGTQPETGNTGNPGQATATTGSPAQGDEMYVVEVSFPANADPIASATSSQMKRNITDILHEAIFKDSILDVHQTLPNVQPDMSSLELTNEYACEPGTVVVGSACVECAPGTYYEHSSRSCVECPANSYQDETRQSQCKSCPNINSKPSVTLGTGVRSAEHCKERCPPGKHYDEQAGFCRPCGHGFYQPNEGSFGCIACGQGLTTRSQDASSKHECRPECEPGQQLSPLGACEPCPQGSYRQRGRPACELCPAGYTTETSGSIERRQCSLLLCPAGHYLNVTSDRCHECPRGYYQNRQQRDTACISCPSDTTTEQEGATSVDNCTNPCFINGQAQLCQANSYCVFQKDSQNYTCECKPKYRMNDEEQCVYVCDDYCLNGGSCFANMENNNRPRCDCPAPFYGERCERKSEFIYVATGIAIGLAVILFMILVIWMICVRTSRSSSSSSMSHIAASQHNHPTKQTLQSLHAASQMDFASQLAAAAAAAASVGATPTNGVGAGPHPNHPAASFYYGGGGATAAAGLGGYADSLAPSHQSAYAHYYDDDDDEEEEDQEHGDQADHHDQDQQQLHLHQHQQHHALHAQQIDQLDPSAFHPDHQHTLSMLHHPMDHHHAHHQLIQHQQNPVWADGSTPFFQQGLKGGPNQTANQLYTLQQQQGNQEQQLIDLNPQQMNNNNSQTNNKDELYDRLKRHLYTGQKGDQTDSGEEAH